VSAGLFAGAAIYITLVEHPARVACGTATALAQFGPSYRRAAAMQALLAAGGCLAAIGAWAAGRGWLVLVGGLAAVGAWMREGGAVVLIAGVALGAVIPFTLIVIFPTNKQLLDPALDRRSPEATALLARWGKLHAVRSAAGTASFVLLALRLAGAL
jgi:hypothetical protein